MNLKTYEYKIKDGFYTSPKTIDRLLKFHQSFVTLMSLCQDPLLNLLSDTYCPDNRGFYIKDGEMYMIGTKKYCTANGPCEEQDCQNCCDHGDIDGYECLDCGKEMIYENL